MSDFQKKYHCSLSPCFTELGGKCHFSSETAANFPRITDIERKCLFTSQPVGVQVVAHLFLHFPALLHPGGVAHSLGVEGAGLLLLHFLLKLYHVEALLPLPLHTHLLLLRFLHHFLLDLAVNHTATPEKER